MGYDLHITRKAHWDDDAPDRDISLEEWERAAAGDEEMRLDGFSETRLPNGKTFRQDDPGIAVWTAWSHHGEAGDMAWFALHQGNVVVKNPDRAIRRKMWRLAQRFGATVQGDDGEFYDCFGNPASNASGTRDYWRALLRNLVLKIKGDPVGDWEPRPFARFPTIDSFTPPESADPNAPMRRVLHIVIPKGSGTPEQLSAIDAARERAKRLGVEMVVSRM